MNKLNESNIKSELEGIDWSSMGSDNGTLKSLPDSMEEEIGKASLSEDTRLKNEIAAEMLAKPELKAKRRSLSNSLEVINTLGYSDKGSFIDITQDTLIDAVAKGVVTVITSADKEREGYVIVKEKNGEIIGGCLRKSANANKFEVPVQKKPDGTFYADEAATKKRAATKRRSAKTKVKEKKGAKYRNLKSVSKLVGYVVRNCGDKPLTLQTQYCTKDENGKYVAGDTVLVTLQPGETMPISKKFLAINSSSIEFSGKFANGIIVSSNKKAKGTSEEILNRYFFKFSAEAGLDIHGEDVKIPIAVKENGPEGEEWVIKDEYLPVFGTLMNKKVSSSSIRGIKADMCLDPQAALAKRLRDVLESTEVL